MNHVNFSPRGAVSSVRYVPARPQALGWSERFGRSAWPREVALGPVFVDAFEGAEVTRNFLVRDALADRPQGLSHFDLRDAGARRVYPELADLDYGPLLDLDCTAALLCGGPHGEDSYWHWTIDYLPRLWALRRAGLLDGKIPLIVNTGRARFQDDSLNLLLGRYRLFGKPRTARLKVKTLHAPSFLARTGVVYPETVDFLREAVAPATREYCVETAPAKIYLSRQGTPERDHDQRHQPEEPALERALSEIGFAIVRCHDRTFEDQVRALCNARVVVAPHGGAMANLAFAPPGCAVLEIATKPRHTLGPSLCAAAGHRHFHVEPGPDLVGRVTAALAAIDT